MGIFRALNIDQQKNSEQYQKDLAELKRCYDDSTKQQEQNHLAHLRNIKNLHDTELAKQREEVQRLLDVHQKLLQIPNDSEELQQWPLDDMSSKIEQKGLLLKEYEHYGQVPSSVQQPSG